MSYGATFAAFARDDALHRMDPERRDLREGLREQIRAELTSAQLDMIRIALGCPTRADALDRLTDAEIARRDEY